MPPLDLIVSSEESIAVLYHNSGELLNINYTKMNIGQILSQFISLLLLKIYFTPHFNKMTLNNAIYSIQIYSTGTECSS